MTMGEKIKFHRKRIGLTQTELGERLGVEKNAVSKWECGRVESISASKIRTMAQLFGVTFSYLIDDDVDQDGAATAQKRVPLSDDAHHVGVLYDRADEKDKLLTHTVLDKYDDSAKVVSINTKQRNNGGLVEIDVFDEPAAAGVGNYLSAPESHREQFPAFMIPKGADFGIRISGHSMEPMVSDGSTVFVKQTMTVQSGRVGVFVLNGESFCKQLIVDRAKQEVRLHSLNPDYADIIVTAADTLITIGQVL